METIPTQEKASISTMMDRLQRPQPELELLKEHMKNEMTKWDHERSNFNHLVHLEKLKVDEKEKEKADLKRDLQAMEEEFKRMSLELRQKENMYTTKEVKRQVNEAKRDAKTLFAKREEVESLKAWISDLEEQNQEYLEQLQEAEKQRYHSHQMMQKFGQQNEWLHQKMAELVEACQVLGEQLKTANMLLTMDERQMIHPLCRAGEWIRDHAKTMERNEARTKRMVIHVLTMAQQAENLDSFFVAPKNEKEHQVKKLLKDVMDIGNRAGKFL
ncbi:hypothetical protein V6N12_062411 [Hibiscus sabdariffa]|uniref:Uncharacterized protein n=1 Tax=Hibiscus sabdariffa TaxID=183260 RepID=A0ABR2F8S2_9ROSI